MNTNVQNLIVGIVVLVVLIAGGLWLFSRGSQEGVLKSGAEESNGTGTTTTESVAMTRTAGRVSQGVGTEVDSITTVRYTNSGFVPFITEVRLGESVRFVNESSKALRVTSEGHPTAVEQHYPGFNASKSIGRGGSRRSLSPSLAHGGTRTLISNPTSAQSS